MRWSALFLGISGLALLNCSSDAGRAPGAPDEGAPTDAPRVAPSLRAVYVQAVQKDAGAGYAVRANDARLVGENVVNNFRASFAEDGVALHAVADVRWEGQIRFAGVGYGAGVHAVSPATMHAENNRVEYRRDGVTEWYVNGPLGLEQGFTIDARPQEAGPPGSDLQVEVDVGGLQPIQAGADLVDLNDPSGYTALRVRDVFAEDARGSALPATLRVERGRLAIHVDDHAAVYPVRIDPTYGQQAELTASDASTNSYFGISTAIDGNTAVIGAKGASGIGAAYVFNRSGTTWTQTQKLTPSDGASGDQYGCAVAISGSRLVVGAKGKSTNTGAAYAYSLSGSTWGSEQKITASGGASGDYFGSTVSMSGTNLAVGAAGASSKAGRAYVFSYGTSWTQAASLTGSDTVANDLFGSSVSISGSSLVVSAIGASSNAGAAYVFTGSSWTQSQKLTASDAAANAYFGNSVSISGTTLIVGDSRGSSTAGAAYIFTSSGTTWSQKTRIASPGGTGTYFGSAVSVSGDVAAITASGESAVYQYFQASASTWTQEARFAPTDVVATDGFGVSVALSGTTATGTTIVAGASAKSSVTGAAYVFVPAAGTITSSCATTPCDTTSNITVTWTNLPGYPNDYVTLASAGSADGSAARYAYTNGQKNGTYTFVSPGLSVGSYVARSFAKDSAAIKVAESPAFAIGPASTQAATLSASCSTNPCTASSTVTVTYSGFPGYTYDWIDLAPQGSATSQVLAYKYTNGKTSGTITFTNLPTGQTIVARGFQNNTYTQLATDSAPIVMASTASSLSVRCAPTCTSTQDVIVDFTGMPGYATDWIAAIQSGRAATKFDRYKYTNGGSSGSVNLGPLPPGTFYVEAFQNNTYTVVGSPTANFTVTGTLPTPVLTPTVTGTGAVSVAYSSMAGYRYDWISVAKVGAADSSVAAWRYTNGLTSGTMSFTGIAAGTYEARAYFDNSNTRVATSTSFVIP